MKKIALGLALCLAPFSASATAPDIWKNPPLAADQSLPHGLELISGHAVITHPEQNKTHDPTQSFVIKVPSTSAHESWWGDQYAEQLKSLGWKGVDVPPLKILNRQNGPCTEQMILISLNPNSHNSPILNNSNLSEMEYSAVAFNYKASGTCKTDE